MKITHLYAGEGGLSHFEDLEVPLSDGDTGITAPFDADGVQVFSLPADLVTDWHNAPRSQLAITLSGICEVQVSDGEMRRFKPGDWFWSDTTTGQGHLTWARGDEPLRMIFLPVPAGFGMDALKSKT